MTRPVKDLRGPGRAVGARPAVPHLAGLRRRLRVAMVVPPYFDIPPAAYGGVEAVVADLADELVSAGHDVVLVGASRHQTRARYLPVWDKAIPERLGEPFPEVMHAALTRRAVQRLASEDGVDLVHEHTMGGPLNAVIYSDLGLPTVVTVHGPVNRDLQLLYRALGREVSLVAISDRQRMIAPDLNWVGTVHNAVRLETWPFRRRKQEYALFLGRFHPDKGPHLAVEAAHAAGVPLVLAGKCEEPAEKEYLAREVKPRLRPEDTLLGVADAVAKRKLLANASCLLFPVQWEEPFGMVMIEAMACGTPVVALRGGAVPEVVADGITGIICDDPGQIPQAMRDSARIDPAACREHVARSFSAEQLGLGYERVYRSQLALYQRDVIGKAVAAAAGFRRAGARQQAAGKLRPGVVARGWWSARRRTRPGPVRFSAGPAARYLAR